MAMIANRANEAAAVKRVLNGGGTILVVGGRSMNFSPQLRQHPRITFWDSTDPQASGGHRIPPDNTRVIMCTRFVRHGLFAYVQRFATKRHLLMLPGLNSTGEIKDVIEMALDLQTPDAPPATPSAPTPPTYQRHDLPLADTDADTDDTPDADEETARAGNYVGGGKGPSPVRVFLTGKLDFTATPQAEFTRLLPIVKAAGFTQTDAALKQMIYIMRREHAGLPSQVRSKATPAAAKAPTVAAPPISNIEVALRFLDDLAIGIGLVREAVLKVKDDDEKTQATMKALRGFLTAQGD